MLHLSEKHPPRCGVSSRWSQLKTESALMKIGEFAMGARALRMSKKAKFDEAFEGLKRELQSPRPLLKPGPAARKEPKPDRPILSLPMRRGS
jgi:hypothetical protein